MNRKKRKSADILCGYILKLITDYSPKSRKIVSLRNSRFSMWSLLIVKFLTLILFAAKEKGMFC